MYAVLILITVTVLVNQLILCNCCQLFNYHVKYQS